MNELHRVFFHEVGHFISHEINAKFYGGHRTESIILEPNPHFPELYIGAAKIEYEGKGQKYVAKREELARFLATSTYGCIFQAYYLNEGLRISQDKNCMDDMQQWLGALRLYELDYWSPDIHEKDQQFLEELRQQKSLDAVMALDPNKYLLAEEGGVFTVDLEKLRADVNDLIKQHREEYDGLIAKYDNILAQPLPE